jgi:DNA mismatch endonuclease (patch repair protein)
MDRVSPKVRSRNMARITSVNTLPERTVRSFLHARGLRYRLHAHTLPGQPDLVFRSRRACVFVHGCFWHGCPKCSDGTRKVKSNRSYWTSKIARNKRRDLVALKALRRNGWKVCVIWECEIENPKRLGRLLDQIQKRKLE